MKRIKDTIKKVLLLGSGGLRIGQAGEFDYSGSQAIKALKQEGIRVVLVNPNIATVQTDQGAADTLYLEPLNLATVTKIIAKEKPDGILLAFGGQTALNLGLALEAKGVLKKYGVLVLGTPVASIRLTEDRELFKRALESINIKTPFSFAVTTTEEAMRSAKKIGYPVMLRAGYSLGGLGSGKISSEQELKTRAAEALHNAPQILIEEYLAGWKEIEYEVIRDKSDTTLAICNMENMDPMGIHTGESIVVAPSQTLTNKEFHQLREVSLAVARRIGLLGEGNVQFALNPKNGDYRVIEMNARLSRSSALASKATGYPLAYVAAKLAIGKRLAEIPNSITKKTTSCFEPALDYIVVKFPRWDLIKFQAASRVIGSEMKSVGEVMAIGRSFPEALQKAVRMLNIGGSGLTDYPHTIADAPDEIGRATDRRLFAIYQELRSGTSVATIADWSQINPWFLEQLASVASFEKKLRRSKLTTELLRSAKHYGFSDKAIGQLRRRSEESIRQARLTAGVIPAIKQIDTLAGEFPAETNYLYTTYHASEHDIAPSQSKPLIILGSGPYCIGSSVEFDWCAVNTARTARALGRQVVMINSNPETVSTDYDESDRLYFEELTLERVRDIADFEGADGIVVSVGGQIANNLALPLARLGYALLGTAAESIDQAEDREKFSSLLNKLNIDQPDWEKVSTAPKAESFARRVGYPILVRPSYVLSGAAMQTIHSPEKLAEYLRSEGIISQEHPVVISQFITNAKELEIDAVAAHGQVIIEAISEHIENAGVHSGDATIVLPPQRLYLETIRRAKQITRQVAAALKISGPFNIQFIAKNNDLKVIECNLRASRSFPFVSKVTGYNFIDLATRVILGEPLPQRTFETLELDYVAVKTPQFSYSRIKGADPVARVEMASTGEVAVIGKNYLEAFYKSWQATEQFVIGKRLLVSICNTHKPRLLESLRMLAELGWELYATDGTHEFLTNNGISARFAKKASEGEPNLLDLIQNRQVDLVINIPNGSARHGLSGSDGYQQRRATIDHQVPLITNLQLAELFLRCLIAFHNTTLPARPWHSYITHLN